MRAKTNEISVVLNAYRDALKTGEGSVVATLFTPDGVLMTPDEAAAVGVQAIRSTFDAIFKTVKLNIQFDVAEIFLLSPDWAFARTTSACVITINETGDNLPQANQELIIFHRLEESGWKIARYSFSVTMPAPKSSLARHGH